MKRWEWLLYCAKKALFFLGSVLLLSAAVFTVARLAPGDPLVSYYGERAEKMSPQEREQARERLGLNDSIPVQYGRWLENALRGEFGISYKYKVDVTQVIADRLGNTLLLGGGGFLLIFFLSPLLGALCAWRENSLFDRFLRKTGTVVSCLPEFWLSLVLILVFSVRLHWLPSSGAWSVGGEKDWGDRLLHLILPLAVVVTSHVWYFTYMVRNRLLEETQSDYVLLAKAKGLSKGAVLFRHCLPNALPAYLSLMAISVPHILGGTYIVEMVFSYPGLGTLSFESARYKDYNLLMLLCLLTGAVVIFCGMIAQIVNRRIDPRLRAASAKGEGR